MHDLSPKIARFLASTPWANADFSSVAGDLSQRQYFRLTRPDDTAILMDASSNPADAVNFRVVGTWLQGAGLSVPRVLASNVEQGLLIVEDFGENTIGARIQEPAFADQFYDICIDLLLAIRNHPAPKLVTPTAAELAEWTTLAAAHYPGANKRELGQFRLVLETIFDDMLAETSVSLRDFHADNLVWLVDRHSVERIGLLDYQDAFLTHPIYDLVSLLTDARSDVSPETRKALLQVYAQRSGDDLDALTTAFAAFSAQRNTRILGVFSRAAQQGKSHHLSKLPRVHGYLCEALQHPIFDNVRDDLLAGLPDPNAVAKALAI